MIPLKMRRLFFGFTPRRLLGINGSILAHCPSLNQTSSPASVGPPIRLTNPLNLNMVNWVLTLEIRPSKLRHYIFQYGHQLRFIDQKCSLFKLKPGASSRLSLLPFIQLLLDVKGIYVNG